MSNIHLMTKPKMARQGDVLLIPITHRPDDADLGQTLMEGGRLVLAHGEATGHAHVIYPDVAEAVPATLFELRNVRKYVELADGFQVDGLYLEARERCFLRHEEHSTIALAPGHYVVIRQHEADAFDELRRVAD